MTCHHALSLLDELIDDELSPQDATELKAHLDVCDACRSEYGRSLELKRLLTEHKLPEPDPEYWSEVSSIIRARTVDSVPLLREEARPVAYDSGSGRRTLIRSLAVFAASLALLVTTLLISNRQAERPTATNAPSSVFMTADLSGRLDRSGDVAFTRQEQLRIAGGSLMVGAPSMVGRYTGLAGFMTTY